MSLLRKIAASIPASSRHKATAAMWRQMDLDARVVGEVALPVASRNDWETLVELFVKGEYDTAILDALKDPSVGSDSRLTMLDLGANKGFFALRVASLAQSLGIDLKRISLTCVEADRHNFGCISTCTSRWSADWPAFKVVRGLAGKRSGTATLYSSDVHMTVSTKSNNMGKGGEEVAFLDLETLVGTSGVLDLVKCDIEGSEEDFITNYPALLRRIRHMALEFHHEMCDIDRCYSLLAEAGLRRDRVLSDVMTPPGRRTTEVFTRA